MKSPHLHKGKSGKAITIRVTPRSRSDEISGIMDDGTINIRLRHPPVDGKANHALLKFLSTILGVKASQIEIVAGHSGKNKLISIIGITPDLVEEIIRENIS